MDNNVALQSKRGLYYKDTEKTVGNLYQLRNEHGLSLETLADEIGVSRQAYNAWENGKREIKSSYLIQLAKYYNVSVDYLLGLSECRKVDNSYIRKKTGLDDNAIEVLSEWNKANDRRKHWMDYLNSIINNNIFILILDQITELKDCFSSVRKGKADTAIKDSITAHHWKATNLFAELVEKLL